MSTDFYLTCDTCDDVGPRFRRSPSGSGFLPTNPPTDRVYDVAMPDGRRAELTDPNPTPLFTDGNTEAGSFLINHEWHDVRMTHE